MARIETEETEKQRLLEEEESLRELVEDTKAKLGAVIRQTDMDGLRLILDWLGTLTDRLEKEERDVNSKER